MAQRAFGPIVESACSVASAEEDCAERYARKPDHTPRISYADTMKVRTRQPATLCLYGVCIYNFIRLNTHRDTQVYVHVCVCRYLYVHGCAYRYIYIYV